MNMPVKWQKIALSALCVFLALVLIVMIFATTYVHYLLGRLGRVDPESEATLSPDDLATFTEETDPNYTGEVVDPTDITIDVLTPTDPSQGQEQTQTPTNTANVVNILLVGQDRRPGQGRQRSDAMILCTFNLDKNTITLTSFLRDSYVYIPGRGNKKLNTAYVYGGFSLLNETLAVNFGVDVDANIEVDFNGFSGVVDLLGGVDITLTEAEASYMNERNANWNLKSGENHLTGEQALLYSRIRYVSTGSGTKNDFGRTERQRTVIMALLNAYKDKGLAQMLGLVDDILPLISTNMSNSEILSYVVDLFPMLASAKVTTQSIPGKGMYSDQYVAGSGACLILDMPAVREVLAELFEAE